MSEEQKYRKVSILVVPMGCNALANTIATEVSSLSNDDLLRVVKQIDQAPG